METCKTDKGDLVNVRLCADDHCTLPTHFHKNQKKPGKGKEQAVVGAAQRLLRKAYRKCDTPVKDCDEETHYHTKPNKGKEKKSSEDVVLTHHESPHDCAHDHHPKVMPKPTWSSISLKDKTIYVKDNNNKVIIKEVPSIGSSKDTAFLDESDDEEVPTNAGKGHQFIDSLIKKNKQQSKGKNKKEIGSVHASEVPPAPVSHANTLEVVELEAPEKILPVVTPAPDAEDLKIITYDPLPPDIYLVCDHPTEPNIDRQVGIDHYQTCPNHKHIFHPARCAGLSMLRLRHSTSSTDMDPNDYNVISRHSNFRKVKHDRLMVVTVTSRVDRGFLKSAMSAINQYLPLIGPGGEGCHTQNLFRKMIFPESWLNQFTPRFDQSLDDLKSNVDNTMQQVAPSFEINNSHVLKWKDDLRLYFIYKWKARQDVAADYETKYEWAHQNVPFPVSNYYVEKQKPRKNAPAYGAEPAPYEVTSLVSLLSSAGTPGQSVSMFDTASLVACSLVQ